MSYTDVMTTVSYRFNDGRVLRGELESESDAVSRTRIDQPVVPDHVYTLDGERLTLDELNDLLKEMRVEVAANRERG